MSLWTAIALTLVASACMNVGLVLQKKGLTGPKSRSAGDDTDRPARSRSPIWYLGLGLLIGGYAMYAWAVSAQSAPISLLQPLSASGLLIVALLAVVYLKERFAARERWGVALLLVGVILLGLSAESSDLSSATLDHRRLAFFHFGAAAAAVVIAMLLLSSRPVARAEFLLGVLTGLLLGTGYLNTKIISMASREGSRVLTIVAIACMLFGLIGGLIVLQMGFRRGRALIVTAVNLVTNQVLVVAGGLVCLGERFPAEPVAFAARIGGLFAILGGIILLPRGESSSEPQTT